jgi:hypothetical protein
MGVDGVNQVLWSLLFFVLVVSLLGGAIAAMVHLVARVHAPAWVIVLVAVPMVLLPVLTAPIYWLVIAATRVSRTARSVETVRPPTADTPAWPPPAPGSRFI